MFMGMMMHVVGLAREHWPVDDYGYDGYGFDDACSWLVVGGLARESTDQLMIMDMMVWVG